MITDAAHLTAAPASAPVDLARLDAALASLRRAERALRAAAAPLAEARDRLAASPDDSEARRAARMAGLLMRGEAAALAQHLAALAEPGGAAP